ncbi:MAG TPA: hypothetical protein VGO00_29920 [Kofleriaceae bacterium]|jgi:hypothetical protein|nr:hypothetical protein [Kofleriaceae bacterium]
MTSDLDRRVRQLEHQLAAARWRTRAVGAVAIVVGVIAGVTNNDAAVSAMAGKRSVSLHAAPDKAEVHYEK